MADQVTSSQEQMFSSRLLAPEDPQGPQNILTHVELVQIDAHAGARAHTLTCV